MKEESDEEKLKKANEELEIQAWGLKKANEGIKLLYKELDAKNKELQKLDQLKDDFISTVSHELRTPLAITKEGLNLILDRIPGEITEKQEKILSVARDNIERLTRLINNLLDISKIESGRIELKRKTVDINRLIEKVYSSFQTKAKEKGVELKSVLPNEPLWVYADSDKLIQVFTNLIANAMKFTDDGNIAISVADKEDEIECVISDTGKGISKEDLPKVFSKFQQFGRTAGAGEKGTGLGLSISKGIIELHKGRMWVESELGEGSKFIFTLPKYTPESMFKEFLNYGLDRSNKSGSALTLLTIRLEGVKDLYAQYSADKKNRLLTGVEDIIENGLRHAGDSTLRYADGFNILLVDCNRDGALRASDRLRQALDAYIAAQGLSGEIKLLFGYASYPAEAKSTDELISKAESSLTKGA